MSELQTINPTAALAALASDGHSESVAEALREWNAASDRSKGDRLAAVDSKRFADAMLGARVMASGIGARQWLTTATAVKVKITRSALDRHAGTALTLAVLAGTANYADAVAATAPDTLKTATRAVAKLGAQASARIAQDTRDETSFAEAVKAAISDRDNETSVLLRQAIASDSIMAALTDASRQFTSDDVANVRRAAEQWRRLEHMLADQY